MELPVSAILIKSFRRSISFTALRKGGRKKKFRILKKMRPPSSRVNFINVLRTTFMLADPKSAKNSQVVRLFVAFGICKCKSCS